MRQRGFSLVELSIVLVILGLLVGGIMAGQSLIRAAELRSVSTDYMRYTAAFNSFRDKYFNLPGDMTNATTFWGSAGGNGANTACQSATHTPTNGIYSTCNGDGDGALFSNSLGVQEQYHAWQHLANAGMIGGSYTAADAQIPGTTVPISKVTNAYFHSRNGHGYSSPGASTYYAGDASTYAGDYGVNIFRFRTATWNSVVANTAPFKPEEAWNIDSKLDDGKPGTGRIFGFKGDGVNVICTTGAGLTGTAELGTTYNLTNNNKDCVLDFAKAF